MDRTGGDLLLDILEAQGIEQIFSSPGTEWAPVWEGLAKRFQKGKTALKYTNCRHESLAVSMAQGYAETSGRMAAVLLHSGVGVLNGSLAVRNAYFARTPMLIISGETYQHSTEEGIKPQGWHWLGLLSDMGGPTAMVNSYVKWANTIRNRERMVDLVVRGCRIAQSPVPGPVFLTISPELLAKEVTKNVITPPASYDIAYQLSPDGMKEAAALLINSLKPIIITEYAGKNPQSVPALVALAESLNIPVFEFFPFFGNFPKNHPLYQGYDFSSYLQEADVVFIAGSTLPWYPPSACLRENVKVILLDEDTLHRHIPQWGYHIDLALTGNIRDGLQYITSLIQASPVNKTVLIERLEYWRTQHKQTMDGWETETQSVKNKRPISARWFLHKIKEIMPPHTLIVDETIIHVRLMHRYLGHPDSFIRATYGGLGVGMGEAIGVKIAYPERPVALIIGDGAFNYNPALAALGLCQEYRLPLLTIIVNNGGYMAMKTGHNALYPGGAAAASGHYFGVDITPAPDYVGIARAFGAHAEKLENPQDIDSVLKRAFLAIENGQPALLDVVMD
ncbi:MAG TPA: thiamine pyrophosphate-binding protein [Dehalococcoidales bacterium]|nr:thiamine pyrophosphate-binding protein [Dehalococcoidales bacterium]